MITQRLPELLNKLIQINSVSLAYLCFKLEVRSIVSDITCAIALLEFLYHFARLTSILKLVKALVTINILFNRCYKEIIKLL